MDCTIQITVNLNNAIEGNHTMTVPQQTISNMTVGTIETRDLITGDNVITIPVSTTPSGRARALIIILPAANAQAVRVKGVTGDTARANDLTLPLVLTFDPAGGAETTFVIVCGGAIPDVRFIWLG